MTLKSEQGEIEAILFRLLDNLSVIITSQTGREGVRLRQQIGRVRADYMKLLSNDGFGLALLTCFRLAEVAKRRNIGLIGLTNVRQKLFEERPVGIIPTSIVMSAITYCLATESRLILLMQFTSRQDVETVMNKMRLAFDTARDMAADAVDSATYQALTFLAGSVTNYLATKSRPLPSMISFHMPKSYPSLKLSYRIYYEAIRAEELAQENKTVHPLFMQRELRGLSR